VVADKTYVLDAAPGNGLFHDILPFLLSSDRFVEYATQEATGSMNPRLLWGAMQRYEFHLPPLDVQKQIANLLWAVERHRVAVNEIASSVDAAADVRLTDLWKQDRDKRSIGDIAEGVTGSTPSKSNKTFWNSEDVPFYTPSEINSDTMQSARQRVSQAGAKVGRLLPENAVAVACIGGDMGKSAVISEPGISNQQITSIVGLQKDDAYALQSLLAHRLGRAAMEARETTTIVRKLNKSDLMKVQIPWPSDRMALRRLVSGRRAAHRALSTEIASLGAIRSSILAAVFGGN
jgi:type I restriction enzyme S subunit